MDTQLTLLPDAKNVMTNAGRTTERCDRPRRSTLYTRSCSAKLRADLERFKELNDITSGAQATKILIRKGLRAAGIF